MRTMLLVEDDRPTALAYEALLSVGHPDVAVEIVWSAEAALLRLAHSHYDVIVSDFKLPGLDGLGLLVASYCLHSRTPFILVSAYGDRALEESAARLGAYAVLHKPIASDTLLDVVDRALAQGRGAVHQGKKTDRPAGTSAMRLEKRPEVDVE